MNWKFKYLYLTLPTTAQQSLHPHAFLSKFSEKKCKYLVDGCRFCRKR